MTPPRISRIAHWAGIALAAPLFAIGLWLLHQYWNGAFGNEVTGKDTAAVIGFIFISTAAVYLAMRWAGFFVRQNDRRVQEYRKRQWNGFWFSSATARVSGI